MENPDFIEVYDGAVDASACADLIARFEASGKLSRGATGSGVNTALKDSWDLCISQHADWRDAEGVLNRAMLRGLMTYVRKHAFLAIAPMQLSRQDPATGKLVPLDAEVVTTMPDAELQALVMKVFRPGKINIQRYFADQGGYPYWHSEIFPKHDDDCLHRVLLWTIYLNDAFTEGETEFLYQQRRIVPRTGSLLLAPAGFTHTHRGNRPKGGNKYIATSWVLFERADKLYGNPPPPE